MPSDFPTNPGHLTPTSTCSHSQISPACLSLPHQSPSVYKQLTSAFQSTVTDFLISATCLCTACHAPLDLCACLDSLFVPAYRPINLNIVKVKSFPQRRHLGAQSYCLVQTSVTFSTLSHVCSAAGRYSCRFILLAADLRN